MFSYEDLESLFRSLTFLSIPLIISALFISWKNLNCRYLFSLLLLIEILDSSMYDASLTWGHYYYLWGMFVCLTFIIPTLARRLLLKKVYHIDFFKRIYSSYHFGRYEGGLLFIFFSSFILHSISFLEASLYVAYIVDSMLFIEAAFSPVQLFLHITAMYFIISLSLQHRYSDAHHFSTSKMY